MDSIDLPRTPLACALLPSKMKFSGFLLGSVFGAASALHCDEHNFLQWSCYTVSDEPSEPTTLSGLATKLHVNPQRLADFNSMADQALALVPRGHMLRVPYLGGACTPQPGLWGCYEVAKTGETIQAVAASSASFWRSTAGVTAAEQVNSRAMHGESAALYVGMHVRLTMRSLPALAAWLARTPPP